MGDMLFRVFFYNENIFVYNKYNSNENKRRERGREEMEVD